MIELTHRDFLGDLSAGMTPREALLARYRRKTGELPKLEERIEEQPTLYMPSTSVPVSPLKCDTDKLLAQILMPDGEPYVDTMAHTQHGTITVWGDEEIYIEKVAEPEQHTIDLIHAAVEELRAMPTLIMLSKLRYMALGDLVERLKYCHSGVHVPFVPAYDTCLFDVRVYGVR